MANPFKITIKDRNGKKRKSEKYYFKYKDADGHWKRKCGYSDKEATRQLAAQYEKDAARGATGLTDHYQDHKKRSVFEHLECYRRHLETKDNTPDHVQRTISRVKSILEGCGSLNTHEIDAARVNGYLLERRQGGLGKKTSNHYLTAIKGFCAWLVREKRLQENPLVHSSRLNAEVDVRVERRPVTHAEFERLIEVALTSSKIYRHLSGLDRSMLYKLAAYTGLRASELASLSPSSLLLDCESPTVTVEAAYSKHRRKDVLPLPRWLADELHIWAPNIDGPLWPGTWNRRAAELLRRDLTVAGIPYVDDQGRRFDFHALRHSFISNLASEDVHPKIAQQLARHCTIGLTMDRYTHTESERMAEAVARLQKPQTKDQIRHQTCDLSCHNGASAVSNEQTKPSRTRTQKKARKGPKPREKPQESGKKKTSRGGTRTRTRDNPHGILSPVRLPIPPLGLELSTPSYRRPQAATIGDEQCQRLCILLVLWAIGPASVCRLHRTECVCDQRYYVQGMSVGPSSVSKLRYCGFPRYRDANALSTTNAYLIAQAHFVTRSCQSRRTEGPGLARCADP